MIRIPPIINSIADPLKLLTDSTDITTRCRRYDLRGHLSRTRSSPSPACHSNPEAAHRPRIVATMRPCLASASLSSLMLEPLTRKLARRERIRGCPGARRHGQLRRRAPSSMPLKLPSVASKPTDCTRTVARHPSLTRLPQPPKTADRSYITMCFNDLHRANHITTPAGTALAI